MEKYSRPNGSPILQQDLNGVKESLRNIYIYISIKTRAVDTCSHLICTVLYKGLDQQEYVYCTVHEVKYRSIEEALYSRIGAVSDHSLISTCSCN